MSDKKKYLTVIIPAYNQAGLIERCIGSLMDSYGRVRDRRPSIEILVIDDGSTDDTWKICQELADRFEIVQVFRQENAGTGAARNHGKQLASGEWITFVDSDDTVVSEYFETILNNLDKEIDLLVFGLNRIVDGQIISQPQVPRQLDKTACAQ